MEDQTELHELMFSLGGWESLLPSVIVLVIALVFRKTLEALFIGILAGLVLLNGFHFFPSFVDSLSLVMQDPTITWVVLVCGLLGGFIQLLINSGSALAFGRLISRYAYTRKRALFSTWLLGLLIFIDDYLNAMTVGATMKSITDKFKISREMLAYVVDSTAAPVCVLIPISTWAIYTSGLLEMQDLGPQNSGFQAYIFAIPFMIYAWVALVVVLLVAFGIIPVLGAMKKAEGNAMLSDKVQIDESDGFSSDVQSKEVSILYFVAPILVLIGATIAFKIDALFGVVFASAFTIFIFYVGKVMPYEKIMSSFFAGIREMVFPLTLVIMSFVFRDINESLHLTEFILAKSSGMLTASLAPALIFLLLSTIAFATGSFWGMFAITIPIVIPLAAQLELNPYLAIGAVVSAGAFGSHACFYGDSTILASKSTGCDNLSHALTQLPYALLTAFITFIVYLILGYLL